MLYNPKAFFTHAALLDQACAHCPIFPTAASRRSLGRVSVPVWLIILSDQLPIIALVGHYPTNKLIGRRLLHRRLAPLTLRCHAVLAAVSRCYPPPMDRYLRVTHPSATEGCPSVRLACVKHAASVRSEPGSNSQVHQTKSRLTPRPSPTNRTQSLRHSSHRPQDPQDARSVCQRIVKTHRQNTQSSPRNQSLNPRNPNQTVQPRKAKL